MLPVPSQARRGLWWLALLALLALSSIYREAPFSGVHWDTPLYMVEARKFAETDYLVQFRAGAADIAAAVKADRWERQDPTAPAFSLDYWHFSRLGHITLLGSILAWQGNGLDGATMAVGMYRLLLALSLLAVVAAALGLARLSGESRQQDWRAGVLISTGLFATSPMYAYLSGNLVSELPAFLFLASGAYALVLALERRNAYLAALAGACLFLVFVNSMNMIWPGLAFAMSLAMLGREALPPRRQLQAVAVAGLAAGFLFALYAWYFAPLASPAVALKFLASMDSLAAPGKHNYLAQAWASGGLLWPGTLLALPHVVRSSLVRFALVWLLLTYLYWLPGMLKGGDIQIRMYLPMVFPLLLLSAYGWMGLWRSRWRLLALSLAVLTGLLLLMQDPLMGKRVASLPGFWRLPTVSQKLPAPRYEAEDYPLARLAVLRKSLDADPSPKLLLVEHRDSSLAAAMHYLAPDGAADAGVQTSVHWQEAELCQLMQAGVHVYHLVIVDSARPPARPGCAAAPALLADVPGYRLERILHRAAAGAPPLP